MGGNCGDGGRTQVDLVEPRTTRQIILVRLASARREHRRLRPSQHGTQGRLAQRLAQRPVGRRAATTSAGSRFVRHNFSTSRSASGRRASASRRAW